MAYRISEKGAILRRCQECRRWITQRGYTKRVYKHLSPEGTPCPCIHGEPGDEKLK